MSRGEEFRNTNPTMVLKPMADFLKISGGMIIFESGYMKRSFYPGPTNKETENDG
jgi:hypothetical protein